MIPPKKNLYTDRKNKQIIADNIQVLDFASRILNVMYTNQAEEALLLLQCISSRSIINYCNQITSHN